MKTLLSLFYVPYLRFLFKFHLVAVPLLVLIYFLRLKDLMIVAPMVYPFALYTTINRHQFKDNIPWMLATFNKKTLIQYHLFAQTLVTGLLAVLATAGVFFTTIATITVLPQSSDKISGMSREKTLEAFVNGAGWMSTKEQCILFIAALFFLTTLYSPVALKDHLRQMEEKSERWKAYRWHGLAGLVLLAIAHRLGMGLQHLLLPLLVSVLVFQLVYLVSMYDRAFALLRPQTFRRIWQGGVVVGLVMMASVGQLSRARFWHAPHADQRVAEAAFLGVFAPQLSDAEFMELAKIVKDPSALIETFPERTIALDVRRQWLMDAQDFGVAVVVIEGLAEKDMPMLADPAVWEHTDKLYHKLWASNPASARWRYAELRRYLLGHGWKPSQEAFSERPALEQALVLEWSKRQSSELYMERLKGEGLRPEALDVHLNRMPAGTP